MKDMNPALVQAIRQVVREELGPIKETLTEITQLVGQHDDKIDSLFADVVVLQDRADSIMLLLT